MEAAATTSENGAATAVADEPTPTEQPVERLFRYSSWVHVGPGAEGCEDVNEEEGKNACSNPLHFHAWCRLPNQFQHRSIREKALAARARRARQLRDESTDSHAVLEEEMDRLLRGGEETKKTLIDELVQRDWWRDYTRAVGELGEEENDDGEKRWGHIEEDQRRAREIEAKPDDEQDPEELETLRSHLEAYDKAADEAVAELQRPRREALEALELVAVVDQVRDQKISDDAHEEFMHVYNAWEWQLCTLKHPPSGSARHFESQEAMENAAPEVLAAIQTTYNDLEQAQQRGASGNS